MSNNIFDTKIKGFLYTNFKNQSNIELGINKTINDANILYENLTNVYGEVSNMSDKDVENVNKELKIYKNSKNKASNIINISINQINNVKKIIDILNSIIKVSQIIIKILKSLPIPAQFLSSGVIITFSDILQKADRKIEQLSNIILNVQPFINKILQSLQSIQKLLLILDNIIGLIEEFLAKRNKNFHITSQQFPSSKLTQFPNSNIIGEYNGFTFELRKEDNPKFQIGNIRRNYAVAIDSHGIERLISQASFASDPQILIDELKQQIDFNNLKS